MRTAKPVMTLLAEQAMAATRGIQRPGEHCNRFSLSRSSLLDNNPKLMRVSPFQLLREGGRQ
jgi:hypothetical protein